MKYISYSIAWPFIKLFMFLYKPVIIGKENIKINDIDTINFKKEKYIEIRSYT